MIDAERVAFVGFASTYGSTRDIALRFQALLEAASYCVIVADIGHLQLRFADVQALVTSLKRASIVLLGSAMHYQDWLPETKPLLDLICDEILHLTCPVHFFTVCTLGSRSSFLGATASEYFRRIRPLPPRVLPFVPQGSALGPNRSHHFFAGRVKTAHWGVMGTLFVKCMGGSTGDHISWEEVDDWIRGMIV